jgi:hypothetical protein
LSVPTGPPDINVYVEYTFNDNVVPLVNDKIADPVPETREEELSD